MIAAVRTENMKIAKLAANLMADSNATYTIAGGMITIAKTLILMKIEVIVALKEANAILTLAAFGILHNNVVKGLSKTAY